MLKKIDEHLNPPKRGSETAKRCACQCAGAKTSQQESAVAATLASTQTSTYYDITVAKPEQ